jgi:hypothetical protein
VALQATLFEGDKPDSSWPRSIKSFGRHLVQIRPTGQKDLEERGITMRWTGDDSVPAKARRTSYTFERLPQAGSQQ